MRTETTAIERVGVEMGKRWNGLGRYQKGVLLVLAVMATVFTALYAVIAAKTGFAYQDAILVPRQDGENTVYEGKLQGKQTQFTVYPDKSVSFEYGEQDYGRYTAREDASAVPQDENLRDWLTGVELRRGEEVVFRGGAARSQGDLLLFDESGGLYDITISATTSSGETIGAGGQAIDPFAPSASAILTLMEGPTLTHKGNWMLWLVGVFVCVVAAASVLFVDELFRFFLAFRVRDAENAEPSDWEIMGRYLEWTVLPILALWVFVQGLLM